MTENTEKNFESAMHSLEEAVDRLESGDLTLEESLDWFERGVKSAALCRSHLKEVETRVELLLKEKDGSLTLKNFELE